MPRIATKQTKWRNTVNKRSFFHRKLKITFDTKKIPLKARENDKNIWSNNMV